ncbi:MAG: response regulator [Alphaproteobacteria bacterium]|nr:response regulator [Alphaproteobacteria bacterium]
MPSGLSNLRVMVVDDEAFVREILRRMQASMEIHMVDEANDGGSALKLMEKSCPDMMILDLVMEPVGGVEILRRMRAHAIEAIRKLKVIVLTLNPNEVPPSELMPLGIEAYLIKPVAPEILRTRIEEAVGLEGVIR